MPGSGFNWGLRTEKRRVEYRSYIEYGVCLCDGSGVNGLSKQISIQFPHSHRTVSCLFVFCLTCGWSWNANSGFRGQSRRWCSYQANSYWVSVLDCEYVTLWDSVGDCQFSLRTLWRFCLFLSLRGVLIEPRDGFWYLVVLKRTREDRDSIKTRYLERLRLSVHVIRELCCCGCTARHQNRNSPQESDISRWVG